MRSQQWLTNSGYHPPIRRGIFRASLLMALLLLPVGSANAAAPSIQNLSPSDGATLPYGTDLHSGTFSFSCPRYQTSFGFTESWSSYFLKVATQPDLGPDGTLATAFTIRMGNARPTNAAETECTISNQAYALNPGTYYWQAFNVDCDYQPSCNHTGPVWSFTVAESPEPDTVFTQTPPRKSRRTTDTFAFTSDTAGATFRCQYAKGWSPCQSPVVFKNLGPGRYSFAVAAQANGKIDQSPAKWDFKVKRSRR